MNIEDISLELDIIGINGNIMIIWFHVKYDAVNKYLAKVQKLSISLGVNTKYHKSKNLSKYTK